MASSLDISYSVYKQSVIKLIKTFYLQSYRKLSKELHSSKHPDAGEKLKEISFAYETLSNPNKRPLYDTYGIKGVQENDNQVNSGDFMSDLFESPFASFVGMYANYTLIFMFT